MKSDIAVLGSEAPASCWKLAFEMLALRATIPLWLPAGMPRCMADRPLSLLRTARAMSGALEEASEEAGRRESLDGLKAARWYAHETQRVIKAGVAAIGRRYGDAAARDLAAWIVGTEPGVEPYESNQRWSIVFGLIAYERPSPEFVQGQLTELARRIVRDAFGPDSDRALESHRQRALAVTWSARERALVHGATDSSPGRDVISEMTLAAHHARAAVLRALLSWLLTDDEWNAMERAATAWPW